MMMRTRHEAHRRHARSTEFIALDSHECEACWACVEACPNEVLGKVDFGRLHRHAKISAAEACTGCFACVRACEAGALKRLEAEPHLRAPAPTTAKRVRISGREA
jgi:2-oxoglutarate ferredoxin oxidoreductase subunit delta